MSEYRDLIRLEPVIHNNIWGGRQLETVFGYEIPDGPVGECWGISAHPHGDCTVNGGAYDGLKLSQLWDDHRELFGDIEGDRFPLLVKILDAREDLSIQVHPDDAYAQANENGSLGKHECWYVMDCGEDGQIVVGQHAHDREEFLQMVEEGRWDDLVNLIPIKPGDFFNIKPGTVHAINGGTAILETQQSSDVTYRVYDYDRHQPDGSLRELHIEQSADVIDYDAKAPASGDVTAPEVDGMTKLMSCKYFEVLRIRAREGQSPVVVQDHPFMCLSVVWGTGTITTPAGVWDVKRGDHLIAPCGSGDLTCEGVFSVIASWVPVA